MVDGVLLIIVMVFGEDETAGEAIDASCELCLGVAVADDSAICFLNLIEGDEIVLPFCFRVEAFDVDGRILHFIAHDEFMLEIDFNQILSSIIGSEDIVISIDLDDCSIGLKFLYKFEHLLIFASLVGYYFKMNES